MFQNIFGQVEMIFVGGEKCLNLTRNSPAPDFIYASAIKIVRRMFSGWVKLYTGTNIGGEAFLFAQIFPIVYQRVSYVRACVRIFLENKYFEMTLAFVNRF